MASDLIIRMRDLGKSYRIWSRPEDRLKQIVFPWRRYHQDFWALRDVNLEMRRGEAVGIVGRNGAGKSTLLQLAYGTLEPTSGAIERYGRISGMLELGAGFNPEFTGRENVVLSALAIGLSEKEIQDRFPAIEEFAAIGDFMDIAVKTYSSGMYARLAFAVAAHVDADVLIVDEILSVGDIAFAQKCTRFIRSFRTHGTLLFVSHSLDAVMTLCDRAVWLDRGELRADGPAREVCRDYVAALEGSKDNATTFKIGGRRHAGSERNTSEMPLASPATEIRVSPFDPEGPWHGRRGGSIVDVRVLDVAGNPVQFPAAGDEIILEILAEAHIELRGAIVGFDIRNRFGQAIFGENTYPVYRDSPVCLQPGQRFVARFRFQLPHLPDGEYAINPALAEGTQDEHVQHHWLDEGVVLRVRGSHIRFGVVGVPMLGIEIEKINEAEASAADAASGGT
ncbi:MAG TPA: ABC transporter ATP-binding protein [Xanthobacteraceae bacterium]|nr:ABC transporter ATP-binding protein [Xanthobacteraceae bacterium]